MLINNKILMSNEINTYKIAQILKSKGIFQFHNKRNTIQFR